MFDFFRDMVNEAKGIDTDKMSLEKKQNQEKKKESYFIFSRAVRNWTLALAALYICVAVFSISCFYSTGNMTCGTLFQFVIKAVISLVVIVALFTKKKEGEIVALFGVFGFLCMVFLSTVLI